MKSHIVNQALRIANRIRRLGEGSRLAALLQSLQSSLKKGLVLGSLSLPADDEIDHSSTVYRLQRTVMRAREESKTEHALQQARDALLNIRVNNFGLYFLLTGILFFILTLLIPTFATAPQRAAALTLSLLSLPLLPSGRSLAYVLHKSRIVGMLLFGICELPRDRIDPRRNGKEHSLAILIATSLSVAIAALISPLYACLGALALIILSLLFSFPELTVYLLAIGFPVLPLLPSPTLITCFLALTAWLSYLCKALCGRRALSPILSDLFALLFVFALFLGAVIGFGDLGDGLAHALLASLCIPVRNLFSEKQPRRRFTAALSLGAFFCASIGIFQYFFTDTAAQWLDAERFSDISMRVTSTFSNPNILSVYLLLCFPFSLNGSLECSLPPIRRAFYALNALTVALCILLTWTRGAWLGLLLQLLLWLLLHSKETLAAGILLIPFVPCALLYLPQSVLHRFTSIASLAETSIRYRLYTWKGVNATIAAHPWGIGVGEAAFCAVYPSYALPGIESVMHAHSVYLQVALECGVVGLAIFLLFIAAVLLKGFAKPLWENAALLSVCGALVLGIFDHLWYFRPLAALFFVTVGMIG